MNKKFRRPSQETQHNGKGCLCFANEQFVGYVNHGAYVDFRFGLWLAATNLEYGEDIGLDTHGLDQVECENHKMQWCEITLIRDDQVRGRNHEYGGNYLIRGSRVDFFITRKDAEEGFLAIKSLDKIIRLKKPVKIFENLSLQFVATPLE